MAIVAWDTTGHVFNNTRKIHSTYTYGFFDCPPEGTNPCTPGFYSLYTMTPVFNSYVENSFTIKTEIRENPRPITAMKAYIDHTVVATSNGPSMRFSPAGKCSEWHSHPDSTKAGTQPEYSTEFSSTSISMSRIDLSVGSPRLLPKIAR